MPVYVFGNLANAKLGRIGLMDLFLAFSRKEGITDILV